MKGYCVIPIVNQYFVIDPSMHLFVAVFGTHLVLLLRLLEVFAFAIEMLSLRFRVRVLVVDFIALFNQ